MIVKLLFLGILLLFRCKCLIMNRFGGLTGKLNLPYFFNVKLPLLFSQYKSCDNEKL